MASRVSGAASGTCHSLPQSRAGGGRASKFAAEISAHSDY